MISTRNPNHVRAVRDVVREAVNQLVLQSGIELHAIDAAVGIAMALNGLIREAPDSVTRETLAAAVIDAMTKAGKASVIVPRSAPFVGHA